MQNKNIERNLLKKLEKQMKQFLKLKDSFSDDFRQGVEVCLILLKNIEKD